MTKEKANQGLKKHSTLHKATKYMPRFKKC
jgi:hypothetical protein